MERINILSRKAHKDRAPYPTYRLKKSDGFTFGKPVLIEMLNDGREIEVVPLRETYTTQKLLKGLIGLLTPEQQNRLALDIIEMDLLPYNLNTEGIKEFLT